MYDGSDGRSKCAIYYKLFLLALRQSCKNVQVHDYERSNRVYNYNLDLCVPFYLTVGDDGNRKKMSITHVDEPGKCPEPSITLDYFMGGFRACNFTSGPEAAKFCWDQQPE
ncbi:unnamed protein product [Fraxinus pennsylvanica]|uniref:Uncharacterized protein n=1 Tax=Fraxinus pennsylvanica TaxID=56036 RepID=A0AAD1ZWU8_9LAMI|nr:unnamed protein product [Fraxinus pennsylvanica]